MVLKKKKTILKKAVKLFLTAIMVVSVGKLEKVESVSAADITYVGTLASSRDSYELRVGDFVVDGSNVWTIAEAEQISGMGGLICTWTHDGKNEILADYQPVKYPDYRHFSMDEEVFAPCYVIISGSQSTIYYSYNEFKTEVGKLYKSGGATGFKAYSAYYAKKEGKTNFIYQNGNLKIEIPVTVSASVVKPVLEEKPTQEEKPDLPQQSTSLASLEGTEVTVAQENREFESVKPSPIKEESVKAQENQTQGNFTINESNSGKAVASESIAVEIEPEDTEPDKKFLTNLGAASLTGVVLICGGVVLFARRKF